MYNILILLLILSWTIFSSNAQKIIASKDNNETYKLLETFYGLDDSKKDEIFDDSNALKALIEKLLSLPALEMQNHFFNFTSFTKDIWKYVKKEKGKRAFKVLRPAYALLMRYSTMLMRDSKIFVENIKKRNPEKNIYLEELYKRENRSNWQHDSPRKYLEEYLYGFEKVIYDDDVKAFAQNLPTITLASIFRDNGYEINAPELFKEYFENFLSNKIRFTNIPGYIFEDTRELLARPDNIKIYANQDGYLKDYENIDNLNKGNQIVFSEENLPVGYNIYINSNKALPYVYVFIIYAGSSKDEKDKTIFFPDHDRKFIQQLLQEGFGVVELNLPDLLKSKKHQSQQEEEVQKLVQDAIHHFVQIFKNNPSSLHPFFNDLKDPQLFLFGGSFGGTTAFKYAATSYGKDFMGYISHAGGLFFNKTVNIIRTEFAPYLLMNEEDLKTLKNNNISLLLLHNLDDNRVPTLVSINFYKELEKKGIKSELRIFKMGNPMRKDEADLKGHFFPSSNREFKKYIKTIADFITLGPKQSNISMARAIKYSIYAKEMFPTGDKDMTQFIAEAFRLYIKAKVFKTFKDNAAQILDKNKEEKIWHEFYRPIYLIIFYKSLLEKNFLKEDITEAEIKNTIDLLFPSFLEYIREREGAEIEIFEERLIKTSLIEVFEKNLEGLTRPKILYYFFFANPLFVNKIIDLSIVNKEDEEKVKNKLIKILNKYEQTRISKKS